MRKGDQPLVHRQVDYIGPLPWSEGAQYTVTCVDTAPSLLQVCPVQRHHNEPPSGLSSNCVPHTVGTPETITSDQGTHFTGH